MPGHTYLYQNGAFHKFKKVGFDTNVKKVKKIGYFKDGVMHQVFTSASAVSYYNDSTLIGVEEIDEGLSVLTPQTITPTKAHHRLVGWADADNGKILTSKIADGEPMNLYSCFRPADMSYQNRDFNASEWAITMNEGSPTQQGGSIPNELRYGVNTNGSLYVAGTAWAWGNVKRGQISSTFDLDPTYVTRVDFVYTTGQSYEDGHSDGQSHWCHIEGYKNGEWVRLTGSQTPGTYGQTHYESADIDTYGCSKLRISIGFSFTNTDQDHNRDMSTTLLSCKFYGDEGRTYIYHFGESNLTWDKSYSYYSPDWDIQSRKLYMPPKNGWLNIDRTIVSNEIVDLRGFSSLKFSERFFGEGYTSSVGLTDETVTLDVSGIDEGYLIISLIYSPYEVFFYFGVASSKTGNISSSEVLALNRDNNYYPYTYYISAEVLNIWLEE